MPMRLPNFARRRSQAPDTFDGVLVLRRGRPYDPAWDLWRPLRRWPGIILSAIVTAGLLTAVAYHFEHKVAAAPKPAFIVPSKFHVLGPYFPQVDQDTAKVQRFSGKVGAFAIPFTSTGDLTSWTFRCQCTYNFDVTVRNSQHQIVGIPENSIGPTRAVAIGNYAAGNYTMDIGADGPWSINFVDDSGLPVMKVPFSYLSSGTSIFGPFPASHKSLSIGYLASLGELFTVQVVDKSGNILSTPMLTIRSTSKNVVLTSVNQPYYLIVDGQGLWLIKVS